jgi:hypothetical protein
MNCPKCNQILIEIDGEFICKDNKYLVYCYKLCENGSEIFSIIENKKEYCIVYNLAFNKSFITIYFNHIAIENLEANFRIKSDITAQQLKKYLLLL